MDERRVAGRVGPSAAALDVLCSGRKIRTEIGFRLAVIKDQRIGRMLLVLLSFGLEGETKGQWVVRKSKLIAIVGE